MALNQPLHFAPILKSVIWGGEKIAPYKGIVTDQTQIGESWEISAVPGKVSVADCGPEKGRDLQSLIDQYGADLVGKDVYTRFGTKFPLLIKIIDARADLSVQVHPDDALAHQRHQCDGKTEMWHVIATDPGAKIHAGLCQQLTPEEYERRVADGTIMDAVASYDASAGDTFFLPAGRIHAIGAGNLLAEIQQTSDITYRIYDYGRLDADGKPRQLHTAEAKDAIDYTVLPDYRSPKADPAQADVDLVNCRYFDCRRLLLTPGEDMALKPQRESFVILMCLKGTATLQYGCDAHTVTLPQGDTLLVPATLKDSLVLSAGAEATVLQIQA